MDSASELKIKSNHSNSKTRELKVKQNLEKKIPTVSFDPQTIAVLPGPESLTKNSKLIFPETNSCR